MRVLVACEESQRVCSAFRALGHEAYSCDILPTSGDHPDWHYQCDIFEVLDSTWDLLIAFPPCTYLTKAGACRLRSEVGRIDKGFRAADFFFGFGMLLLIGLQLKTRLRSSYLVSHGILR